ncbi:MAG: hypothetical protein HC808_20350, partial [Candidatus Competibacteraceae bacterium]|nr:hypothetical protein [Candidatus Competibacteraceae bacterium]
MSTPDLDALATLQQLPQATHCLARMGSWLEELLARDRRGELGGGLSVAQHLERLRGFGASEIGTLVGEHRGLYNPFDTARELVARKLLLDLPEPGNAHLRRGVSLEPLIRAEFLQQSGAIRREDLTQQLAAHRPSQWPWMQATPDDVVEINGVLGVIDYKAPAEPISEVSLSYHCQLHQIGLLAQDVGLPLAFRAVVAWNMASWSPDVLPCPHDPALEQEIIAAGSHYWTHHVLTGELPPWPTTPRLNLSLAEVTVEAKQEIEALANRFLRLEMLAKEAKTLKDEARERLFAQCHTHQLGQDVASGAVKLTPQSSWDKDAVEARLSEVQRVQFTIAQWDT